MELRALRPPRATRAAPLAQSTPRRGDAAHRCGYRHTRAPRSVSSAASNASNRSMASAHPRRALDSSRPPALLVIRAYLPKRTRAIGARSRRAVAPVVPFDYVVDSTTIRGRPAPARPGCLDAPASTPPSETRVEPRLPRPACAESSRDLHPGVEQRHQVLNRGWRWARALARLGVSDPHIDRHPGAAAIQNGCEAIPLRPNGVHRRDRRAVFEPNRRCGTLNPGSRQVGALEYGHSAESLSPGTPDGFPSHSSRPVRLSNLAE